MKTTHAKTPFVLHEGRWYLIPTFYARPSHRLLSDTLKALLERHPPGNILILRPMSPSEVHLLMEYRDNFDTEAFATMCCNEEKRLGRPTTRRGHGGP